MVCSAETKQLWIFRVNWFLTLILSPLVYSLSYIGILSSFHRFVTDPRLNGTDQQNATVEGGLGESELFYSLVIAVQNFGSVIGSLSNGILVRYIPYLFLFIFSISLHIIGYVLYGVANRGWILMIGELLSGYFIGAQGTLSYSYVTDSSSKYVDLLRAKNDNVKTDINHEIRVRNYLFALKTLGNSLGASVAAGTAILLSHLPVDQYRTIAWVNVGCGGFVLITFILFFQDIIITMFLLVFVDVVKWGFFETLMNPILGDSFGFTLSETTYFYLGFSAVRIGGAIFVTILQRMKVKPQVIGIIGVLTVVSGYLIIADWQTIPYDPCTECSPYHHPDLLNNLSACVNATHSDTDFEDFELPYTQSYHISEWNLIFSQRHEPSEFNTNYSAARNACMHAEFPHRQCHWIPFSLIAHIECEDCQPICRSIKQTLSFPQFVVGMALLVGTNAIMWFPMIAIISNQTPPGSQGIVIGIFFTASTAAQSVCPIFLDALYEGFKKRTFAAALIVSALHLPFLAVFIVLFRKLGPKYRDKEDQDGYTKLIINADREGNDDC